jgi:hypothetical protein
VQHTRNRSVRQIEGRPVVLASVEVKKIHHRPQQYTIDQVANRTAKNEAQCEAEQRIILMPSKKQHDKRRGHRRDSDEESTLPTVLIAEKTKGSALVESEHQLEERRDLDEPLPGQDILNY